MGNRELRIGQGEKTSKKKHRREARVSANQLSTSNELGSKDTMEGLDEFGELIGVEWDSTGINRGDNTAMESHGNSITGKSRNTCKLC